MSNRYSKRHYEDVAGLLHAAQEEFGEEGKTVVGTLAYSFSILFAADNPPSTRCWYCGDDKGTTSICTRPNEGHRYGGFDRERFLAACGLET